MFIIIIHTVILYYNTNLIYTKVHITASTTVYKAEQTQGTTAGKGAITTHVGNDVAEHLALGNNRILRLRWALYGLKQASSAFRLSCGPKGLSSRMQTGLVGFPRGRWGALCHLLCGRWLGAAQTVADALVDMVRCMFEIQKRPGASGFSRHPHVSGPQCRHHNLGPGGQGRSDCG
jgi:hypothetical protein